MVTVAPNCWRTLSQSRVENPSTTFPSRMRLNPVTFQVTCLPVGGMRVLHGARKVATARRRRAGPARR
jgi:hypothetical protein